MLKKASEFLSSQKDYVAKEVETFLELHASDLNNLGYVNTNYHPLHIKPGAFWLFEEKLKERLKESEWRLLTVTAPKYDDYGSMSGILITVMPEKDNDYFFG